MSALSDVASQSQRPSFPVQTQMPARMFPNRANGVGAITAGSPSDKARFAQRQRGYDPSIGVDDRGNPGRSRTDDRHPFLDGPQSRLRQMPRRTPCPGTMHRSMD